MKKNRITYLLVTVCLVVALLAGCGGTNPNPSQDKKEGKPEFTLKMAHTHSPESMGGVMMQKMADLIETNSDGRIAVDVFPAGQLGDKIANLEGLRAGTVDITQCAATDMSSFNERWSVFSLPFMFADVEQAQKAYLDDDVQAMLESDLKEVGFNLLAVDNNGSRSVINKKRPVNEPADCAGLKIRTLQDVYIVSGYELCGFTTVALGYTEVYSAIQQGTVDGAENSAPYVYDSKYQELCDYYSITEMIRQPGILLLAQKTYDSLPDDLKKAVDKAQDEYEAWQWAYYEDYDTESLQKLKDEGVIVNSITPENRKKFLDATKPVYDKFFTKIPKAQELYDLMMAVADK